MRAVGFDAIKALYLDPMPLRGVACKLVVDVIQNGHIEGRSWSVRGMIHPRPTCRRNPDNNLISATGIFANNV